MSNVLLRHTVFRCRSFRATWSNDPFDAENKEPPCVCMLQFPVDFDEKTNVKNIYRYIKSKRLFFLHKFTIIDAALGGYIYYTYIERIYIALPCNCTHNAKRGRKKYCQLERGQRTVIFKLVLSTG